MKKVNQMIASAPTKSAAISALETLRIFSNLTEQQYQLGRKKNN